MGRLRLLDKEVHSIWAKISSRQREIVAYNLRIHKCLGGETAKKWCRLDDYFLDTFFDPIVFAHGQTCDCGMGPSYRTYRVRDVQYFLMLFNSSSSREIIIVVADAFKHGSGFLRLGPFSLVFGFSASGPSSLISHLTKSRKALHAHGSGAHNP